MPPAQTFPPAVDGLLPRLRNYVVGNIPVVVRKDHQRFYKVLAFIIVVSFVAHAAFLSEFLILGVPILIFYNCFSLLFFSGVFFMNRGGRHYTAMALLVAEFVGHAVLCVHLVGWEFGFQYYMIGWGLVPFLAPAGHRVLKSAIFVVSCGTLILLYEYSRSHPVAQAWNPAWEQWLNGSNLVFNSGVLAFAFYYFRNIADQAYERSENLLRNVLPEKIADRLKAGDRQITDRFEETTVLFLDIVNFTPLADSLAPDEVVRTLNRIFTHLDEIAGRLQLEKIKTIGDAYMVAGGIPEPQPDHARRIGLFALEAMSAVKALNSGLIVPIDLRIGIHTGPSVAGVIGQRKFSYDLWGDTVNVAARMESHGLPGKIQVSNAYRSLIVDEFTFEDRGFIDVKGKGRVETHFLHPGRLGHQFDTPVAKGDISIARE